MLKSVSVALKVFREYKAHKAPRVFKACLVLRVSGTPSFKVLKAYRGLREFRAFKALKVHKVYKVKPVSKDFMAYKALKVRKAFKECRGRKV
jgi:hypothetical protein